MDDANYLYHEALTSFRAGKVQDAIRGFKRTIELDPKHLDAFEALGVCYAKVNQLDQAIETIKRLVKAAPNHLMAHTNLSRFYAEKGMILEAEREQAEARRLSWKAELKAQKEATGAKVREKTPEEEARERESDIQDRISRYKKVIELDPKDVLGYFSLGTAYTDGNYLEDARKSFEQAIQVGPKHSPSFFSLGVVLESLGNKPGAIDIYERGIPIADANGDMIPLKKMQARLEALRRPNT